MCCFLCVPLHLRLRGSKLKRIFEILSTEESLPYSCHCLFKLGQSVMRLCGANFFSVKILYSKLVSLLDRISLSLKPQAPGVEWNSVRWKKCIIIATWLCYLLRSLPMISPVFVEFACKLSKTWIHRMVNEMMVRTQFAKYVHTLYSKSASADAVVVCFCFKDANIR